MWDKSEEYSYIPHEEWCELLFTMEVKDSRKIYMAQIKRLENSKAAPVNYDRNTSVRVTGNKKSSIGVLTAHKQRINTTPKHHGDQH